jgi:serine/threonine-protein kinase
MELLNGQSFKKEIASGPLEPLRLIQIAKQICQALAEAHENHIVHRDIKPSNIFILRGDRPYAKLLDFGLVKNLTQSLELSQTGIVMGSPMYMSPEQVESSSLDHRSDIYSLGMTLYHALSGRAPFSGELTQVMMSQLMKYPP